MSLFTAILALDFSACIAHVALHANIFSIWDRMFGTYTRDVDFARLRYGLDEHQPHGLRQLLAMPFVRPRA